MDGQRDDLNSLDDTDALPPNLQDVHRLLLRDGARWRVRLPDSASHLPTNQQDARVDYRVVASPTTSPGSRGSQHIQQTTRKEVFMDDTTQTNDRSHAGITPPAAPAGRFRTLVAVGAALAIVALFAGLLYTFGPGRTTAGNTGKQATHTPPTATTQPKDNGWPVAGGLQQQPAMPVFEPSHPATIYEAGPVGTGLMDNEPPTILRRSDDGGKTWHTLALPSATGSAIVVNAGILISPLDAQKVVLGMTIYLSKGVTTCPAATAFSPAHSGSVASSGSTPLNSTIPLGGYMSCNMEYFSADGGQHWSQLHAPGGVMLGNGSGGLSGATMTDTLIPSTKLFAQGSRLYAYAYASCGSNCGGPKRIVTSTDGGATWVYADDALASQNAQVCSFMPTSSGSTVFALTNTVACQTAGASNSYALWTSNNAGASWSRLTLPAGDQMPQSVLVVNRGSGQPLLYLTMQAPAQSHVDGSSSTPTGLHVSMDGGQHWSAAPASGAPADAISTQEPVGVLSDGTVVESFYRPVKGQAWPVLYGWKHGDAAWRTLSNPIVSETFNPLSLTIVPGGSGERDQFWLVTAEATQQTPPTYSLRIVTVGN